MRATLGQLRQLIREELDPFPDPSKAPSLAGSGRVILRIADDIDILLAMLRKIESSPRSAEARKLVRKGTGLAQHAADDMKALEALLMAVISG